jgi:hypothetical protein
MAVIVPADVPDLTIWTQDSDFAVLQEMQPALQVHGS